MDQIMKCPDGFEKGNFFSCHAICPPGYKYEQNESGTSGPPVSKCVHFNYNSVFYTLSALPQLRPDEEPPSTYASETIRVQEKQVEADKKVAEIETLRQGTRQRAKIVQDFNAYDAKYSVFKDTIDGVDKLKKLNQTLIPLRPATAPSEDFEKERIAILSIHSRDLFFIQFSLFLLMLVFLAYLTLSTDTAHVLSLLLLSVGVSIGFFLTR
jgi:hypothetical protein